MPTLAPGPINSNRGFTLVEALVVLLIIGIITAAASLGTWSSRSSALLLRDAQRLAQLLSLAHTEARAWDINIQWHHDPHGYWFEPLRSTQSNNVTRISASNTQTAQFQNGTLRRRDWSDPEHLRIVVEPNAGYRFNADWFSGPSRITLSDGITTVSIQRAASGLYEVVQ